MKQLFYRHVHRDNCRCCGRRGVLEVKVGPCSPREAQDRLKAHRADPVHARLKNCYATVQPFDGTKPDIEVCTPGCAGCRHGYHNEVRDAA